MLNLYGRHQPPCSHSSRRCRNCNCPIWVQGFLPTTSRKREPAKRRSSSVNDRVAIGAPEIVEFSENRAGFTNLIAASASRELAQLVAWRHGYPGTDRHVAQRNAPL